jgi:hypothetical protein
MAGEVTKCERSAKNSPQARTSIRFNPPFAPHLAVIFEASIRLLLNKFD